MTPALLRAKIIFADTETDFNSAADFFATDQRLLVASLADTIIPETETPGASAVGVQDFVELMIGETFLESDQIAFMNGLAAVEQFSRNQYGKTYAVLSEQEKNTLLKAVAEGHVPMTASGLESAALQEFFHVLKELTVIGYYTSETGAREELRYRLIPGNYKGCTDMADDQVAWFFSSRMDGLF